MCHQLFFLEGILLQQKLIYVLKLLTMILYADNAMNLTINRMFGVIHNDTSQKHCMMIQIFASMVKKQFKSTTVLENTMSIFSSINVQ